ncbi:MAG TPA: heme ABC exporter ATP-binding protein CcmA, partial [Gemmatimonadales bacterium]|nr:heme ABC exporter ATP-binding protein CcmA [Gemmatimonadales bacterium]
PPPLQVRAPVLAARNLERRFGSLSALRGVSLVAHSGECHLVVGPNGAGKSTLLRLLAGLARPTAGAVLIEGAPVARDPSARRNLGLLSHQSYLYDELTPVENLAFAARLFGLKDPAGVARLRLQAVGLAERSDEPVRRLSRGMIQRVAIARALLHSPRVLLLDEPFTGLDPRSCDQVRALLAAERDAGRVLVLVSHDVHESWELATHVHLLIRGAWETSGPRPASLDAFLSHYRSVLSG